MLCKFPLAFAPSWVQLSFKRQRVICSGSKHPLLASQFPWRPQPLFLPEKVQTVNEHETIHINCSLILLFFISMPLWILDYKYAGSWGERFSWFDISLECRCAVKWDIVYSLYEAYKENTLQLLGLLWLCLSYIRYVFIPFQTDQVSYYHETCLTI